MTTTVPSRSSTAASSESGDFKVADLSLAEFGRKEIELAEHEMPGLMSLRDQVRRVQAADRCPHHRLAAHDHPDRGPHRDPRRARRCRAVGVLQHLLDPGPRGRGDRRRRASRCSRGRARRSRSTGAAPRRRCAGRTATALRRSEHDPRRRWRRDAGGAPGRRVREGRPGPGPVDRGLRGVRDHPQAPGPHPRRGRPARGTASRRTSRASPRRPPPACTGCTR